MRDSDDPRRNSGLPLLGEFFHLLTDMVENNRDEVHLSGNLKPDSERNLAGSYRFNVKFADSVKPAGGGSRIKSLDEILGQYEEKKKHPLTVEPAADVVEDGDRVTVIVELPGVRREDIEVSLEGNILLLKASGGGTYYEKKLSLPFRPEQGGISQQLRNGIYTLEVEKPGGSRQPA